MFCSYSFNVVSRKEKIGLSFWFTFKGWLKKNWLLMVAILIGGGLLWLSSLWGLNPNGDSARYMLSAMAQVIATLYVITIAVMQLVGLGRVSATKKLFTQGYFIFTTVITFFGISLPLVILSLSKFCVATAICLSYGIGNLVIIGWFIFRMLYGKDLIIEEEEKVISGKPPERELSSKSLIDLRRLAEESLSLGISSNAIEVIEELLRRAREELQDET